MRSLIRTLLFLTAAHLLAPSPGRAEDPAPSFHLGLNLNGPSVTIDGHRWEGGDSKRYECDDKAFENQGVPLIPPTDPERAKMIRSSRWGGNKVELLDIPSGTFTLFLYVWEDNNSETFTVFVNGRPVAVDHQSGAAGRWQRLGPWYASPTDGRIEITSKGGAANFSGIEVWRGRHDGLEPVLSDADVAFFEKRVRPVLVDKCHACHSATADEPQGGLLVDSRATIRKGGLTGPAVVAGDVSKSLLIEAIRYENSALQMPPDGKLSEAEIADLTEWVRRGAPDPRVTATRHPGKRIDLAKAREFRSFRPLADPLPPPVGNTAWPRTDIDRFVLAELEARELQPAPDADRRILARRVTYDLTGLPPTPEEVAAFVADESDNAWEHLVDRLLASPHYGERWGRHWLDVVRYADTAGDNSDYPVPQMRLYRDWVIDAFNRDLPYDEFVRDQLAGDLREAETSDNQSDNRDNQVDNQTDSKLDDARRRRVIATGYIANARRFGSRVDDYPWHLTIEDTLDNLGRSFLGLSLGCARCHDHKFDPITTADYYGLYGIFAGTRYPWPGIELDKRQRDLVPLVPANQRAEAERQLAAWIKERDRLDGDVKSKRDALKKAVEEGKSAAEQALNEAEARARAHRGKPVPFETAYAVAEGRTREDVAIQLKGDPARPGDIVRRHFPAVLGGGELPEGTSSSGRLELAEWIVSPANPLTLRVLVNRVWAHHFGTGLVPTPNDFGKQGKPPSHPALLDHLASAFRRDGWSIKSLHRTILRSRVYRLSSARGARAVEVDPSNVWLSSFPRRRLDAEEIRDTLLVLGGSLDTSPAGAHPFPPEESWDFTQHKPFKASYDHRRRGVYLMTPRIQRPPFQAVFDGADPSTSTPVRATSTTPMQALWLLNDPFVHEQAARFAERIASHGTDLPARVDFAHELLFARPATSEDIAAAEAFLGQAARLAGQAEPTSDPHAEAWRAYVRALCRLNEFLHID
jgi:hypothetical protein